MVSSRRSGHASKNTKPRKPRQRHPRRGASRPERKPRNATEAGEWLKQFAGNLRDIQARPDEIPLDVDLANWFISAVDAYTLEEPTRRKPPARSMDAALGLKRPAGRLKGTQTHGLQTAIHIHYLLLWGETWDGIADRYQKDKRTVQRIYETHSNGIIEHLVGKGLVPFGYHVDEDGRLAENKAEAATVRMIFKRFARTGPIANLNLRAKPPRSLPSVTGLLSELRAEGVTRRGKLLDKTTLFAMLNNPIYVGETVRKGMYPGGHKPIVSRKLWNRVREILSGVTPGGAAKTR
jgi:hypothetical protein